MAGTTAAKPILSKPEQLLYGRLVRAFPGHVILVHVALSRLLLDRARDAGESAAPPRCRQCVADFVVCKSDFEPLAVVELDDRPHARAAQSERERRKDEVLRAAGLKVIRVPGADIPTEIALKTLVATLPLGASTAQLMRRAS